MPKLIVKFESAVIKEVPVANTIVTVGRKSDNDIVIDHPAVSGHHCRVLLQGDTYFVEDLNSTNGTMVNDKKIIKAGIHNQDKINIAKHVLLFVDDRAVSAQELAQRAMDSEAAAALPVTPPPAPAAPVQVPGGPPPPSRRSLDKIGGLRVLDGAVDQVDFELSENSTYIGKSDRVAIKIKGMFAPEVAAMISNRSNGYFLVSIKDGSTKVNGISLQGERLLNEGDSIEVGSTKMQFYLKSPA